MVNSLTVNAYMFSKNRFQRAILPHHSSWPNKIILSRAYYMRRKTAEVQLLKCGIMKRNRKVLFPAKPQKEMKHLFSLTDPDPYSL